MISIRDLHKKFSHREVLKGIHLDIPPHSITGIVGPNSCGKTTLMKSILGLVIPQSGEIFLNEKPIERTPLYRKDLGYMAQVTQFPENLKVSEIFDLLEELRGTSAPKRKALSEYFEMSDFLEKPFGVLSGGAKQRVGAVVAFMFDPQIIVLDEPTASLDPEASLLMRKHISTEMTQGKTIILISHVMSEIEKLAQNIILMMDGMVLFHGSLKALKESVGVEQLENAIVEYFRAHRRKS